MPQKLLNCSNIIPVFQQMRCRGVPEGMAGHMPGNIRLFGCPSDSFLKNGFMKVVPAMLPGSWVNINPSCWKDPLP